MRIPNETLFSDWLRATGGKTNKRKYAFIHQQGHMRIANKTLFWDWLRTTAAGGKTNKGTENETKTPKRSQ